MEQLNEASNILLLNIQQKLAEYGRHRREIMELCDADAIGFPDLPDYHLAYILYAHVSYPRWEHILQCLFPSMDPPIVQVRDRYTYTFLPEAQMSPQQRRRSTDICMCLPGAVWTHLSHPERVYMCGVVQGIARGAEHIHKLLARASPNEATSRKRPRTL